MFYLQGRVKSAVYIYILKIVRFILLKSFILAAFGCNKQNKQQINESQELFLFPNNFHIRAQKKKIEKHVLLYRNINAFIKVIGMSSSCPSYSQAVMSV